MIGTQGPVGPRLEPGAKPKERDAERAPAEETNERPPGQPQQQLGEVTLSNEEVLALDLAMTRKQAAVAEEKLAALELKDAQTKLMSAVKGEVVMLARIANAHKLPGIQSAKLVGNRLIFQKG